MTEPTVARRSSRPVLRVVDCDFFATEAKLSSDPARFNVEVGADPAGGQCRQGRSMTSPDAVRIVERRGITAIDSLAVSEKI